MRITISPPRTTCPGGALGTGSEEAGRPVYSTALSTGRNEARRRPWPWR